MLSNKRMKDIVEEVRRTKNLKIEPLDVLDSYYGEIENELIQAFANKKRDLRFLRNFILEYRRRNRNG
jgi:hypothetical protein